MIVLALRTDNPQAEVYLYEDGKCIAEEVWLAHRELSATIHNTIQRVLSSQARMYDDIGGIIFYQGPGSFTGLRIGVSVANAFGSSLQIPVVATRGETWCESGLEMLQHADKFIPVEPFYGAEATITTPKK